MSERTAPRFSLGLGERLTPKFNLGLQGLFGLLLFSVVLLAGLMLVAIGYWMLSRTSEETVRQQVEHIQRDVTYRIEYSIRKPVQPFVRAFAQGALPASTTLEQRLKWVPLTSTLLKQSPVSLDVAVAYGNGDFFMVRELSGKPDEDIYDAPPGARFVVTSGERGRKPERFVWLFYDDNLKQLASVENAPRHYDPREYDPRDRPWYRSAMEADGVIESGPRLFIVMPIAGISYAMRASTGDAVVVIDVALADLAAHLAEILPTPNAKLALLRPDGALIASANGADRRGTARRDVVPALADLPDPLMAGVKRHLDGGPTDFAFADTNGRSWLISVETLSFLGEPNEVLVMAIPRDELPQPASAFLRYTMVGMGMILLVVALLQILVARRITRPLRALTRSMQEPGNKDGATPRSSLPESGLAEIRALSEGVRRMKGSMDQVLSIAGTISAERDVTALLGRVLRETLAVARVDGGLIFLLDEHGDRFSEGCLCSARSTGEPSFFEVEDDPADVGAVSLTELRRNERVLASLSRDDQGPLARRLAYCFDDPEVKRIDLVCVPLRQDMSKLAGVLILFRAMRQDEPGFRPQQIAFIEALANTTAVAVEKKSLLKAQVDMRTRAVQMIAHSIDAKSAHTGGHCRRVPIIFEMLLQSACDADEGPLKDFTLDADGWEEARLAAWLHDWGKVTTPEYVMDKATKLETQYDRIHEIRTRFEVLKRDAEIAALRAILDGADAEAQLRKLSKELARLDSDFAFVAGCNTGSEYLDDDAIARLVVISQRTWQRTLDKRLGVSRDEGIRMGRAPERPLPVTERLLMDSPEHLIRRPQAEAIPKDNPWRFKLDTPQYLYNRGELYNLRVRRGTLTPEERYKINDHMTQTIIMLEGIPLPQELRNVPEIAGAHHERVDGKGYPRGLVREQMSWQARMMAIADIFEALTAADRPYKPSKTLSEALAIMAGMKANGHIDPDLYDLFIATGVPQRYAADHLPPAQNDL